MNSANTPEQVMTEARSFMMNRVLLTAAELDLFSRLHEDPQDAESLARHLDLDRRALTRLLDTLTAFGFLQKETDCYRVSDKGAVLTSSHPRTVLPMIRHYVHLWESWSQLTEVVRYGQNADPVKPRPFSDEARQAFIEAMHVIGRDLAEDIAACWDASGHHCLLDVGGGSGTYTIAFLRRYPRLKAILFDLESVIPMARRRLGEEGLDPRVELVAGDFLTGEFPLGCDLALLSAIIHQNSREQNVHLYRKLYHALDAGGTILIRDHIMDPHRTRPAPGALFALNMLVNTEGGDTFTLEEVREDLLRAGFEAVRLVRSGEAMDCLVEARKPSTPS